jgi:hypothetical protein
MAHAFSDEGRKHAVRMLAKEVAAIEAERDRLRVEVETLKAERNAAGMRERNELLVQLENWKAYAERLEEAGNDVRDCLFEGAVMEYSEWIAKSSDAARYWKQAKETKP